MQTLAYGLVIWEIDKNPGDPKYPHILAAMLSFQAELVKGTNSKLDLCLGSVENLRPYSS